MADRTDLGTQLSLTTTNLTTNYQYSARALSDASPTLNAWFDVRKYTPQAIIFEITAVRTTAAFTSVDVQVQVSYDGTNVADTILLSALGDTAKLNVTALSTTTGAGSTTRQGGGSTNILGWPYFRIGGRSVGANGQAGDSLTVKVMVE